MKTLKVFLHRYPADMDNSSVDSLIQNGYDRVNVCNGLMEWKYYECLYIIVL